MSKIKVPADSVFGGSPLPSSFHNVLNMTEGAREPALLAIFCKSTVPIYGSSALMT